MQGGESALKAVREELGMSQQEFATKIGVSTTSISRWERGASEMSLTLEQIRRLEDLLSQLGMTLRNLPDNVGPNKHN